MLCCYTGIQNEDGAQAEINRPIMTNMLYHAATFIESNAPVESKDKLATKWGNIKDTR
ncbi:hypothetical protein GF312_10965 [Candidatus Poribacteria bacterium]|nr:hypothetical protein [Candidatus Poribacteria bacterium]